METLSLTIRGKKQKQKQEKGVELTFCAHYHMYDWENTALPERVAAINQFIGSTLESPF